MIRFALLALVSAFLAVPTVDAQVSVYGTYTLVNFNFASSDCAVTSFLCFSKYPSPEDGSASGAGGGVTFDMPNQSRFKAGLDLRGSVNPGTPGGGEGSISAKLSVVPRRFRLRPYVQLGFGVASGHTTSKNVYLFAPITPGPNVSATNAFYAFYGGLDVRLTQSVDLRLFDVGGGANVSSPSGSSYAVAPFSFSVGAVYHFRS